MNRKAVLLLVMLVALGGLGSAATPTAATIMERVDLNSRLGATYAVATMTIQSGRRRLVKEMEMWSDGEDKALVSFRNPEDKGTRYLKIAGDMWMFFPEAENLVKISGHMLRQGMMGSDFSYQDALESEKLSLLYDFSLTGSEKLEGRDTYSIVAVAKPGAEVAYPKRVSWVDKEWSVIMKEELYAASGKLMKETRTYDVKRIGGFYVPTRVVMENKLRKDSSTTLTFTTLQVGVALPADTFSLRRLSR